MTSLLRALVIGSLLAASGCAAKLEIQADPGADVSGWQSWDWLPGDALLVYGPEPQPKKLEIRLAHLVREGLARRGFVRDREAPDLYVGVVLAAQRSAHLMSRTGAVQSLSSLHDASFEVQAAETEVEIVHLLRLEIFVSERRSGRLIWQGRLTDRISGDRLDALDGVVEQVVAELPARGDPPPGDETRLAEAAAAP